MHELRRNSLVRVVLFFLAAATPFVVPNAIAQNTDARRLPAQRPVVFFREGAGALSQTQSDRLPEATRAGTLDGSLPLPLFSPLVAYDVSSGVVTVAIADVNGDGKPDVVVAANSGVAVLLGNGDGTLQSAVNYAGGMPWMAVVGDVNHDGKPDIVVVSGCGDYNCTTEGSVGVLLGNGDGTFQPFVSVAKGRFNTVAIGDFNGDGKMDLAVTDYWNYAVDVFLGNGDGTFQSPVSYSPGGAQPAQVIAADVNRDGHTDLVVLNTCNYSNCWSGVIGVLLGNGDGTFQPAQSSDTDGDWNYGSAVADLNGDGIPDVVVTEYYFGGLEVLLGNGDGSFQTVVGYPSTNDWGTAGIVVADVNGDGKPDLVATIPNPGLIDVFLGNGDGTFQPPTPLSSPMWASSLAVADLDGNGHPDLVIGINALGVMLHVGDTPTTVALGSTLNPSIFGQPVTLTATVGSSSSTPTGMVYFYDSSTQFGSSTLANGSSSISVASLSAGSHAITAVYQGSTKYNASESTTLTQVVNTATTTTSLASLPNPEGPGQKVKYTATITSQYGGTAGGSVTLQDGGSAVATIGIKSGNRAVYSTSYALTGTHAMTAIYSGDSNNISSTSPTVVEAIVCTTSTSLVTSGSPSMAGQPVTFTASVTSNYGSIPNGELLTFYDGSTVLSSVPLAGGTAAYTTSSLSGVKTHYITAGYAGDSIFHPSNSNHVVQVVERYSTTTTVSASPNPSSYGQAVTWTATVTSTGTTTPTGQVTFVGAVGSGILSGGTATYVQSWLNGGAYAVTAEYKGDAFSAPSASQVLNHVVNPASTTTTVSSSLNPSSVGQTVTFTAKVASSTGASPVGTVTFTAGTKVLGTVKIGNSPTSISTSTLPVGSTVVEATYNGGLNFVGSTGTITQTVNP